MATENADAALPDADAGADRFIGLCLAGGGHGDDVADWQFGWGGFTQCRLGSVSYNGKNLGHQVLLGVSVDQVG
ncbi:hypothetical protein D3C76_1254870 [compost metagenome]